MPKRRKAKLVKRFSIVHTEMKAKILKGKIERIDSETLRKFTEKDANFKEELIDNFEIFPQIQGHSLLVRKKQKV